MSRHFRTFSLVLSVLSLSALGLSAPAKLTPNTVSGRVVDERGKPVVGVKIIIAPAMFRGTIFTSTDAQGRYQSTELNPATNPYYVTAYKEVKYHDQRYCLRMAGDPEPYQDALNAKAGAVRNFVWRIHGESDMPSSTYGGDTWGGTLAFERVYTDDAHVIDRDATVEVTLVPDGPLIDGSKGTAIARTLPVSKGLGDIPVGYYKVSASLKNADGTKTPLQVGQGSQKEQLGKTTMLLFRGFDSCGHSGTLRQTPIWLARP
ncbi:carboxypeptidase-like regulatory domain-containing protein [Deinococcus hopiensis]|uniref:Carboxypeptidase regulatory-like domain-containing protein n=1 Tax=Deinococcus hopiensis KR-140 TaxID=695939 RepID=A0A1W1VUL9_9DEIO|nr:carboxypeptidase-like regulatory domain-containing protein [Deinococcus hopiensis]SMB96963.1 Carboxypeptidase regulatory-like domain-containing protein [Deinococcus hopiensis KR-140]